MDRRHLRCDDLEYLAGSRIAACTHHDSAGGVLVHEAGDSVAKEGVPLHGLSHLCDVPDLLCDGIRLYDPVQWAVVHSHRDRHDDDIAGCTPQCEGTSVMLSVSSNVRSDIGTLCRVLTMLTWFGALTTHISSFETDAPFTLALMGAAGFLVLRIASSMDDLTPSRHLEEVSILFWIGAGSAFVSSVQVGVSTPTGLLCLAYAFLSLDVAVTRRV